MFGRSQVQFTVNIHLLLILTFFRISNRYRDRVLVRRCGIRIPVGVRLFLQKRPNRFRDPPKLLLNRYRGFYRRVKRPECDVDYSLLSRTETNNERSYIHLVCLHGIDRDSFSVFLIYYVPFCFLGQVFSGDKASKCFAKMIGSKLSQDTLRLSTVFFRRFRQILSTVP
jgi:hypothetical protein